MNTVLQHSDTPLYLVKPKNPSFTPEVCSLHKLGWNVSCIARALSNQLDMTTAQSMFKVKQVLVLTKTKPFTYPELYPLLPFNKFIEADQVQGLQKAAKARLSPIPKTSSLTQYDIHLIILLTKLNWKKKLIAKLFQVSNTLISVYTTDTIPWTLNELKEIFPSLFK